VIAFEIEVRIDRRVEEVFAYISDPLKFPRWNSPVQAVRKTSGQNGVASTYSIQRELPTGRAINDLEVVASEPPRMFAIRTAAGPTPFLYRYQLSAENGETVMRLDAEVEQPGAAAFLPQLARRLVKKGVKGADLFPPRPAVPDAERNDSPSDATSVQPCPSSLSLPVGNHVLVWSRCGLGQPDLRGPPGRIRLRLPRSAGGCP
jgi:uncharacterized protein YndB with AHSA1/START domain